MINHRTILYGMVAQWELKQRLLRQDPTFDGWKELSKELGYKSASTLRNMCLEPSENNHAKLGFDDSIIIQARLDDYRLLHAMKARLAELKCADEERRNQLNLFSEPIRSLEELL